MSGYLRIYAAYRHGHARGCAAIIKWSADVMAWSIGAMAVEKSKQSADIKSKDMERKNNYEHESYNTDVK